MPTDRRAGCLKLALGELEVALATVTVLLDMVPLGIAKWLRIIARAVVPWSTPSDLRFGRVKREVSYAKWCQVLSR